MKGQRLQERATINEAWSNTHTMAVLHHGLYNFTVFFFYIYAYQFEFWTDVCLARKSQ